MCTLLKSSTLKEWSLETLGKVKRILLSEDNGALYLITEDKEDLLGRDRLVGFIFEEDECNETKLLVETEVDMTEEELLKKGNWMTFGSEFGSLEDLDISTLSAQLIFTNLKVKLELKQIEENEDYSLENLKLYYSCNSRN